MNTLPRAPTPHGPVRRDQDIRGGKEGHRWLNGVTEPKYLFQAFPHYVDSA